MTDTNTTILTGGAAHITLEIEINAPVAQTWQAMIDDIGLWWRKDFLVCEGSLGMILEPRIGGLLYEKLEGDGCGFVWGHVISFQPNRQLTCVAQIVPPWGGPAQSIVEISLSPGKENPDNTTLLTLSDSLIGHISDEMTSSMVDGWQMLYGEGGLKSYVESK